MLRSLGNLALFKIGWLGCVMSAAHGQPVIGTALALLIVGAQMVGARFPGRELLLVLTVGILGLVWESTLVAGGWLDYASGFVAPGFAPHWIVAMWLLFASTLNVALRSRAAGFWRR